MNLTFMSSHFLGENPSFFFVLLYTISNRQKATISHLHTQ